MRWTLPQLKRADITDVWFAWYPVSVGYHKYIWFEYVLRTREYSSYRWFRGFAMWIRYYARDTNKFERSYCFKQEHYI